MRLVERQTRNGRAEGMRILFSAQVYLSGAYPIVNDVYQAHPERTAAEILYHLYCLIALT